MKEAFNFMFKDNLFKKKVLIYFAFIFLANLFTNYANLFAPACKGCIAPPQYYILYFIGSLIMLVPSGYGVACIKALIAQQDNYVLPFVNVKNNFFLGFKIMIAVLIMVLLFTLFVVAAGLLSALIYPMSSPLVIGIIGFICVLAVAFYSITFSYIFASTESFISFINFKKATNLIKNGVKHYILTCLLFLGLTVLTGIMSSIFTLIAGVNYLGIAIVSALVSIISCYTVYVFAYLTAKSVKENV